MSVNNQNALIIKFSEDYEQFSQQMESRVAIQYKQKSFRGEIYVDDFINKLNINEYDAGTNKSGIQTNRLTGAPTVNGDIGFTRRRLTTVTKTWTTYKSDKDIVEMAKDPEAEVVREAVSVMNRVQDNIACRALYLPVEEYNGTTYVPVALPATQEVVDAAGMTVDALLELKEKLDDEEVETDGRCIVTSAAQLTVLLGLTEAQSSDFNTVKALVQGEIDTFVGFKFIRVADRVSGLNTATAVSGATPTTGLVAVAFQKDCMLFGTNLERNIQILKDPAHYGDWMLMVEEQYGAIRREDVAVAGLTLAAGVLPLTANA